MVTIYYFFLQWIDSQQPVFQVLLIITSFILAWGEAWFLDCRVIPQERHARNYVTGIILLFIIFRSETNVKT